MFSYTFQWFVDKYEINCGAFVKSRINIRRWNICMAKLFWTAINNSLHVQTTHQSCKKSHTLVPLKRNKYISLSHNVFSIESTNNSIFNILLRCSMHASLITGQVKIRFQHLIIEGLVWFNNSFEQYRVVNILSALN